MEWNKYFIHDNRTGSLIWKVGRGHILKGTTVTSKDVYGYYAVGLNYKTHKVHRVIWEMYNGKIPKGYLIDHINQLRDDNRIENLRLANKSLNGINSKTRTDNKTGIAGVFWRKDRQKYAVYLNVEGKRTYFGCFENLDDAIAERKKREELYFSSL